MVGNKDGQNLTSSQDELTRSLFLNVTLSPRVYFLILDLMNEDKTINRRALGRKVFGNKVI